MITFGSYFAGLFYFAYCDLTYKTPEYIAASNDPLEDNFMLYFNIYDRTNMENLIMMMYFSFTSLSTVGLGDYQPRGNRERSIASMMMISGVLLTSFIMENLNRMIFTLNESNKEFEEYGELNLFVNIFTRFNGDVPLTAKHIEKIFRYFEFRWQ